MDKNKKHAPGWGGRRVPGPGKALGPAPGPYPRQNIIIRATDDELAAIQRLSTRERTLVLLAAVNRAAPDAQEETTA